MRKRYLQDLITQDALDANKIAFLNGPRQVGKTTLVQSILEDSGQNHSYFSFDDQEFRKAWIKNPNLIIHSKNKLLVLDEIHKDKFWKTKLKGLYDLNKKTHQFIVTGSARLDYFRKSGDSLQGRYIPYRLHPFSLCESMSLKPPPVTSWDEFSTDLIVELKDLISLGGFPEPLWGQSENKAQRWRRLHRERMIREDARELEAIREINQLESLSILLPEKIGGQLSIESIRGDLSTSYDTIKRWIGILEVLYFCYRIRPYSNKVKNSIRKEPKLFLFDWGLCENPGAKWENLIASHLLKNAQAWTDAAMGEFELYYLRDKQKREVDFLMTKNKKPWLMVEVKTQSNHISKSLQYYNQLLKPDFCFQLVKEKKLERRKTLDSGGIEIITADRFLSALN